MMSKSVLRRGRLIIAPSRSSAVWPGYTATLHRLSPNEVLQAEQGQRVRHQPIEVDSKMQAALIIESIVHFHQQGVQGCFIDARPRFLKSDFRRRSTLKVSMVGPACDAYALRSTSTSPNHASMAC